MNLAIDLSDKPDVALVPSIPASADAPASSANADVASEDETLAIVRAARAARRRATWRAVILGVGFPVALLLVWEAAARFGWIDKRFFPAPSTIASAMATIAENPDDRLLIASHVLATLRRLGIGYGLGAVSGLALGVVMGLNLAVREAVGPLLYGLFPLPKIAIYPLMIVVFGIGDTSAAALATLGVMFMVCINTLSGIVYANPIYRDVAAAFRMPAATRWFRVVIPSAMPSIVTGLRLGLGQALILIISSEFISSDSGVGRLLWDAWQVLDIPRMFLGLFIVLILGGLAAIAGNVAERKLIPWKDA